MMLRRVSVWVVALAALGVALVALWPGRSSDALNTGPREKALAWLSRVQYEAPAYPNVKSLEPITEAVVRVQVDDVGGPFWNSSDGRAWDGDEETLANVYSTVHVHVIRQWSGSPVPDYLVLYVPGDANQTYSGAGLPPYAAFSGGFEAGRTSVLFLKREEFAFEGGRSVVEWSLAGQFEGNFRLEGNQAVGSDTRFTRSTAALRATVDGWRASGPPEGTG